MLLEDELHVKALTAGGAVSGFVRLQGKTFVVLVPVVVLRGRGLRRGVLCRAGGTVVVVVVVVFDIILVGGGTCEELGAGSSGTAAAERVGVFALVRRAVLGCACLGALGLLLLFRRRQ